MSSRSRVCIYVSDVHLMIIGLDMGGHTILIEFYFVSFFFAIFFPFSFLSFYSFFLFFIFFCRSHPFDGNDRSRAKLKSTSTNNNPRRRREERKINVFFFLFFFFPLLLFAIVQPIALRSPVIYPSNNQRSITPTRRSDYIHTTTILPVPPSLPRPSARPFLTRIHI